MLSICYFFFSSRSRHTRLQGDWSSDVCSSDLEYLKRTDFVQVKPMDAEVDETGGIALPPASDGIRQEPKPLKKASKTIKARSEERRVGKESRTKWRTGHTKNKHNENEKHGSST